MILFEGAVGRVIALEEIGVNGNARLVGVRDDPIDFVNQRSIITRMTVGQESNVQFLHTLGTHIYIYVFGDKIGTVNLSGLSFSSDCDKAKNGQNAGLHGGELMLAWYKRNRVAKRSVPVRVMIGSTPIEGFVVGFTEDVIDPMTHLIQWGVTIRSLPEE